MSASKPNPDEDITKSFDRSEDEDADLQRAVPVVKPDPVQAELKMLREAYQQQGQVLALMQQAVSRLEQQMSGVANDISDIKKCLNGHYKP